MNKHSMRRIIFLLFAVSAVIYAVQIILFHQPETTAFYIFQDLAFMPVTIAIATLVVGELINEREHQNRLEKSKMLQSTFYTELGNALVRTLLESAAQSKQISELITFRSMSDRDLKSLQEEIFQMPLDISLSKEIFNQANGLLLSARTSLMVLSSNPLLFEHEAFTDLLWSVFHLMDEYQLRGEFDSLSAGDLEHLNLDYEKTYRQLLSGYIANAQYLHDTYPNLFAATVKKIRQENKE